MSALSALLARDRVVPPHKIDEAIQRQVINGGDLETHLLEMGVIDEDTLAAYDAAVYSAEAATRDEVINATSEAYTRLPRAVAEAHRVVPLRLEDGGARLVAAATAPLGAAARAAVAQAARVTSVDARIVTPVRLAWGLAQFYGVEMQPRLARLAARLATPGDVPRGVGSTRPVAPSQPAPAAQPQANKLASALAALSAALSDDRESEVPDEPTLVVPPADPAAQPRSAGAPRAAGAPLPGVAQPPATYDPSLEPLRAPVVVTPAASRDANARGAAAVAPPPSPPAAPAPVQPPPAAQPASATAREPARNEVAPAPATAPRIGPRVEPRTRRAPSMPSDAGLAVLRAHLASARNRGEIIGTLLEFVRHHVAYAALFMVHGDLAEGLDADGEGLDADGVRGIAVPLDAPGAFRLARQRGEPVIGRMSEARTDRVVRDDLRREGAAAVAIVPIHIGGRVVLMLWTDNGASVFDHEQIDAVSGAAAEAARAFERLIVERKKRKASSAPPPDLGAIVDAARKRLSEPAVRAVAPSPPSSPPPPRAPSSRPPPPASPAPATTTRGAASRPPPPLPTAGRASASPPPTAAASDLSSSDGFYAAIGASRDPVQELAMGPSDGDEVLLEAGRDTVVSPPPIPREDAAEDPAARSTRFARGGRVPIAVDVVGPLPGEPRPARPARPRDPRREPDDASLAEMVDDEAPLPDRAEIDRLVTEVVRSGVMTDAAANRLIGAGEPVLEALFRHFPGPVTIDRTHIKARLPSVAEAGPLLRLVMMFRQTAAPYLIELLESPNAEQRYFATLCLGETVHAGALTQLLPRVFDADTPTRIIALEVLRAYRKFHGFEQALRALRSIAQEAAQPAERRRLAINALGELRDADAVPALLATLGEGDASLVPLARRALVVLARQDFGEDLAQWRDWWEQASRHHRVEWLIEALLHSDATIRHEASEELKKLTGQFFGYYFNLPRREREKAYRRYLEWWDREGKEQFGAR